MHTDVRLVCAFVSSQEVGERFKFTDWPLHATVVPWFRLKAPEEQFNSSLQETLTNQPAFTAHVSSQQRTRYGSRRVTLLERNEWQSLHEAVFSVVAQHAGVIATKLFIGTYYRPHVTFQRSGHLNPGEEFLCDNLYVVQREGGHREIVSKLALGYGETAA